MYEYDDLCIQTFLENQLQLFPETVAETPEEAMEFLDICMAAVCNDIREVREYFNEYGADITGMKAEDLEEAEEVFPQSDGRYLVVIA